MRRLRVGGSNETERVDDRPSPGNQDAGMTNACQDVHRTLEYRTDAALITVLPYGLLLCLFGLFMFTLDDQPPVPIVGAASVVVAAGLGLTVIALVRRLRPARTMFALSPAGIRYQMSRAKAILIPWREIKGVDIVDISVRRWAVRGPSRITLRDVTVILLSKQFYDSHIFIDSWLRRGPFWALIFQRKGPLVQMALHPDTVSETPEALRGAIEARWQAFRDQPGEPPSRAAGDVAPAGAGVPWGASVDSIPGAVVVGARLKAWPAWDAVKVIVPLIALVVVVANLLGLWATAGQIKARAERKAFADSSKAWQEEQDKFEQENKEREKHFQELFNKF